MQNRNKIPVLLWWSWKIEQNITAWWYMKALKTAVSAVLNLNYFNWLALWNDFESHPSPLSAKNFAEYNGFYLDPDAHRRYPILAFINPHLRRYMLYSDTIKQWWYIEVDWKKMFSHPVDSIAIYEWWYFKHTSMKSSHIFDAQFHKRKWVSDEWHVLWDTLWNYGEEAHMIIGWTPTYQ